VTGWRGYLLAKHGIAVHPAADDETKYPLGSAEELAELAADIDQHRLRIMLCLWRASEAEPWQLIDGRRRVAAMFSLVEGEDRIDGALALAMRYDASTDPRAFVKSANDLRRHINREQKRAAIVEELKADPSQSDRAIAKKVGSGHPTVAAARSEAEATGKFTSQPTRRGLDGRTTTPRPRAQTSPAKPLLPPPRPETKEEWRRRQREEQAVAPPAPSPSLAQRIENFRVFLWEHRAEVEAIEPPTRITLARGLANALVIGGDDLIPSMAKVQS
jgi:hypothetical protein